MGMSTHVIGYLEADETFNNMKSVWDACNAAGIEPPLEVALFFGHEHPGDAPGKELGIQGAIEEWQDDYRQGFQLDIRKLPKGVHFIRFYNSW